MVATFFSVCTAKGDDFFLKLAKGDDIQFIFFAKIS